MKATLSKAIVIASLLVLGGQAFAAEDAHEGYQRGFYGKHVQDEGSVGKAAFGVDTAKIAFTAPQGGTRVLTTNGLQAWSNDYVAADKVVSSGGASSLDAHEGYRRGIAGKF